MAERELIDKDKLVLRGLQFHGFHGVKREEKTLGQKFVVDVDAWMDLSAAGETDSISDTVSYTDIYRIAKDVVEGPSRNLLEAVVHQITSTTLLKFPQISAIRVKVGKPHVAVQGIVDYLGVEILRHRKDMGGDRHELHSASFVPRITSHCSSCPWHYFNAQQCISAAVCASISDIFSHTGQAHFTLDHRIVVECIPFLTQHLLEVLSKAQRSCEEIMLHADAALLLRFLLI